MISILVIRGAGDRPGPDISDPLITTPTVAIARGTTEIDRQISHRQEVVLQGPLLPDIAPGSIVEYVAGNGAIFKGKLLSTESIIKVSGDTATAYTSITIEVSHE